MVSNDTAAGAPRPADSPQADVLADGTAMDDLLSFAVAVARDAGRELLGRSTSAHEVRTKTSTTDPVSEADRAAERLIVSRLVARRPDDAIVAEEGTGQRGTSGVRWVVDPLDGTVNYLYGLPAWCVSIAAEDDAGAFVGVVHEPVSGAVYRARRGAGAFLDDQPLRANDPVSLDMALVGTGFGYEKARRAEQAQLLPTILPTVRDIRRGGSAALDLCQVAAGRLDGYYEHGVSAWDWAAGALVAAEAGAVVREIRHPGTGVAGVAAAGPALLPALLALIDRAAHASDGVGHSS